PSSPRHRATDIRSSRRSSRPRSSNTACVSRSRASRSSAAPRRDELMKLCGFEVGLENPFFLIAGPCVVESEQLQMDVAGELKAITSELGITFICKSSYDKA